MMTVLVANYRCRLDVQDDYILRNKSHLFKRLGLDHDDHTEEQ